MGKEKGSWIVRMERVVITDVVCDDCTEDEARNNPWEYSSEETDVDQRDWTVLRVEPNT